MHILRFVILPVLILVSCGSGGPVTPLESFNAVKQAVEKRDIEAVTSLLTESSLKKIEKLRLIIKSMDSRQLTLLSGRYGIPQEKLPAIRTTDAVNLYFFSDASGIHLGRYFTEKIMSIDIKGGEAVIKVESGVELDFKREGPYWKFDISAL